MPAVSVGGVFKIGAHARLIVLMQVFEPGLKGGEAVAGLEPQQAVEFVGPGKFAGREVPIPTAGVRSLLGKTQPLHVQAGQLSFRLFYGDVAENG